MEPMRNVRSVSLGIWVKIGSRHERPDKNGISHFLEHMFFKGTKKRTAKDIAVEMDSLGGDLNAFTSKESTTFFIKVLDEFIDKGVELLTDVFLHSVFPEEEIEKEKGVIREEIKMVEDTPDDYIHDLFNQEVWGAEGLGQPVLGKEDTLTKFSRGDLIAHIRKYYGTADTIVACTGKFDTGKLLDMLNRSLGSLRRGSEPRIKQSPVFNPGTKLYHRKLSEVQVCLGIKGIEQASLDRYCLLILNTVLGGGLSSRLFQKIREERGLAYSVYSFMSAYLDTGLWAVYTGTGKKKVDEVIETTVRELKRLPDTITEAEFQRAKNQLKGNLILGLESTSRRMQNIANQEIYFGRYYSPAEIIKEIDSVSLDRAREVSERLIRGSGIALTVLGPVEGVVNPGIIRI